MSFTLLVAGDSHRHRQPKARDFYISGANMLIKVYWCPYDNVTAGNMPTDNKCPECGHVMILADMAEIETDHQLIKSLEPVTIFAGKSDSAWGDE